MENELSRIDYIRELIEDCRYDDALELLHIASEEEPDNPDYNYELARIFMEMGNYASAISNLELVDLLSKIVLVSFLNSIFI